MMFVPGVGEIVVRIPPLHSNPELERDPTRRYEALIYTHLPLSQAGSARRHAAAEWRGLPLRGAGQISLPWSPYQHYVLNYQAGAKEAAEMYERLREALSPELTALVDETVASPEPRRVWWASEAPELDDMPWDLLFYGWGQLRRPLTCTFVRGAPPLDPPPILPLRGPLRLAWCDGRFTPAWLRPVLAQLPGIEAIPLPLTSREAASRAAAEGYELLHLCSDGIVTLATEGVLYDHGDSLSPELTANELSSLLRGSRVSVVGLSVQTFGNPDSMPAQDRDVVSAYRAFAWFSSSRAPLPSIVAPVGPVRDDVAERFWQAFYAGVGMSHRLDVALADGRQAAVESTFALFLRHAQGKLFRSPERRSGPQRPELMATDLRTSQAATQRLAALRGKYGSLPSYLEGFAIEEGDRQKSMLEALNAWAEPEEDER